jgi:hypothetical protein
MKWLGIWLVVFFGAYGFLINEDGSWKNDAATEQAPSELPADSVSRAATVAESVKP